MQRRTRSTRTSARSRAAARTASITATRRSFLRVIALAGTALAAGAAAPLAAPAPAKSKRTASGPPVTAAMRKEIDNQKGYVSRQLKVIRDFALPTGSEPAFVFRAMSPRRRGGK